jgi:hypothetical protein
MTWPPLLNRCDVFGFYFPPMKNVVQSEDGVKASRGAKDPVEVTQNVLPVPASSFDHSVAAGSFAQPAHAALRSG